MKVGDLVRHNGAFERLTTWYTKDTLSDCVGIVTDKVLVVLYALPEYQELPENFEYQVTWSDGTTNKYKYRMISRITKGEITDEKVENINIK